MREYLFNCSRYVQRGPVKESVLVLATGEGLCGEVSVEESRREGEVWGVQEVQWSKGGGLSERDRGAGAGADGAGAGVGR